MKVVALILLALSLNVSAWEVDRHDDGQLTQVERQADRRQNTGCNLTDINGNCA